VPRPTGSEFELPLKNRKMNDFSGIKAFGTLVIAAFVMVGGALLAGLLAGSAFGG
jgi:hypothetical protein